MQKKTELVGLFCITACSDELQKALVFFDEQFGVAAAGIDGFIEEFCTGLLETGHNKTRIHSGSGCFGPGNDAPGTAPGPCGIVEGVESPRYELLMIFFPLALEFSMLDGQLHPFPGQFSETPVRRDLLLYFLFTLLGHILGTASAVMRVAQLPIPTPPAPRLSAERAGPHDADLHQLRLDLFNSFFDLLNTHVSAIALKKYNTRKIKARVPRFETESIMQ